MSSIGQINKGYQLDVSQRFDPPANSKGYFLDSHVLRFLTGLPAQQSHRPHAQRPNPATGNKTEYLTTDI